MADTLLVDATAPVATLAFNQPARQNALTGAMLTELAETLRTLSARGDIRAVILRGVGDSPFSSGFDLGELPERPVTPEEARAIHAPVRQAAEAILACRHPVVAAIRGFAYGAGLELAVHCDLRIAAEDARFSMPPARFGFLYPYEGIRRFVEVVGLSHATALFLLGETITATRAYEIGLVHRLLGAGAFEDELEGIVRILVENAPLAMRETKAVFNRACWEGSTPPEFLETMYARIAACLNSEDVREGRRAFLEKRRPVFRGG